MKFDGATAAVMPPNSLWHRIIAFFRPWYDEDEVEARHARSQAGMVEAQHSIERAAEVTTGARRDRIRASAQAIADRLDGQE